MKRTEQVVVTSRTQTYNSAYISLYIYVISYYSHDHNTWNLEPFNVHSFNSHIQVYLVSQGNRFLLNELSSLQGHSNRNGQKILGKSSHMNPQMMMHHISPLCTHTDPDNGLSAITGLPSTQNSTYLQYKHTLITNKILLEYLKLTRHCSNTAWKIKTRVIITYYISIIILTFIIIATSIQY